MSADELRARLRDGGFESLGDRGKDGVYAVDLTGTLVDGNAVFFERTGLTREQLPFVTIGSGVEPEFAQAAIDSFAAASRGQVRSWRAMARDVDGRPVQVLTMQVPFYSNGEQIAVIGIVRDMDEIEQTRQKAQEVETRLSGILDSMSDGIFFLNRDWVFTYANQRAEEMSRHSIDDLLGSSLWDLFPHLIDSDIGRSYRYSMSSGTRTEFRGYSPGLERWVVITANPTSDGIAVYARDIGDEVEARTRLQTSEQRTLTQAALLDAARDAMIVRNLDGTIAYWNRAATDVYGWTSEEAIGASSRDLLYDNPREFDAALAAVFVDGHWYGTLQQRRKDGRPLTVEGRWTLVRAADGDPDSIFEVTTDITQQLATEQRQLRAQRLESLGRLAGGIAHDLNNVLTPILLSSQLLADQQADADSRDLAVGIERAAVRGADLIKQVLAFARGDDGHRERISVASLILDVERFCRETLPKDITVGIRYEQGLPDVQGDPTQLMQVLVNIVVNARDAMPDGGSLVIGARRADSHSPDQPDSVVIEISDSGTGMDPSLLETIFEPFFTTKAFGEGTGLGLATSLSICQRHGGTLTASSETGVGSVLRVELPALPLGESIETAVESHNHRAVPARLGSGELVLVVDDEADIRRINCQVLEAAGFRTIAAADGAAGLRVFEAHQNDVRLVVTDIMMPVLDGAALIRALQATGYTGPVLAMSGGLHAAEPIRPLPNVTFLAKPYNANELVETAHELITTP